MSLFLLETVPPVVMVHVPKTGGTSIRTGRQAGACRLYDMPPEWRGLPVFGFVRDPFDRIESCWRDFRYLRPATALEFEAFIEFVNRPGARNFIDNPATVEHHAAPMTHPVHGLQHADFIGHYDHLQAHMNDFCREVGVSAFELPRLRDAGDAPRAPRTKAAQQLIQKHYSDDIELVAGHDWPHTSKPEMALKEGK